jgi:hypothetical protein
MVLATSALAGSRPKLPPAYALVVGSNRPGEGQEKLNFSHNDAERFGAVLTELGGFKIKQLFDPDVDTVRRMIGRLSGTLERVEAGGQKSVFVFYYSGHARSNALTLGDTEFSLTELR